MVNTVCVSAPSSQPEYPYGFGCGTTDCIVGVVLFIQIVGCLVQTQIVGMLCEVYRCTKFCMSVFEMSYNNIHIPLFFDVMWYMCKSIVVTTYCLFLSWYHVWCVL